MSGQIIKIEEKNDDKQMKNNNIFNVQIHQQPNPYYQQQPNPYYQQQPNPYYL